MLILTDKPIMWQDGRYQYAPICPECVFGMADDGGTAILEGSAPWLRQMVEEIWEEECREVGRDILKQEGRAVHVQRVELEDGIYYGFMFVERIGEVK